MSFQRRMKCDVCEEVKAPAYHPPEGVKVERCPRCVRAFGWPDPEDKPLHCMPLDERIKDPDVYRFHAELARHRQRKQERAVPHVPTSGNFREFVV